MTTADSDTEQGVPAAEPFRATASPPTAEFPAIRDDVIHDDVIFSEPRRPRRRIAWGGVVILVFALAAVIAGAVLVTQQVIEYRHNDPGVAACEAIVAAYRAGTEVDQGAIAGQLLASRSEYLRQAGEVAQRLAARADEVDVADEVDFADEFDIDEFSEAITDVIAYAGLIGAGCTEVGVDLPPDMFRAQ